MTFLCLQESELYGLLATAKSLQIKGLTDAEDNGGNEPARTAAPPQQPRDELYKKGLPGKLILSKRKGLGEVLFSELGKILLK